MAYTSLADQDSHIKVSIGGKDAKQDGENGGMESWNLPAGLLFFSKKKCARRRGHRDVATTPTVAIKGSRVAVAPKHPPARAS